MTTTQNEDVVPTVEKKTPRSARLTLTSLGAKLVLMAIARPDGTGTTYAATTDLTTKKTTRGMTKSHPTFNAAVDEMARMATAASKIGWERPVRRGFVAKPDAFSTLPAARKPKAK